MTYPHWQYFLAIESDLKAISKFVEFSQKNFSAYSIEFARILLSSSSEADVVAKALCRKLDATKNYENINDYRNTITVSYRKFHTIEVSLPRYGLSIKPWEAWGNNNNPSWWKSYNEVKHQRDTYFEKACLENALLSVGGLFALVLYYYNEHLREPDFFWPSFPKLMLTPGAPDLIWTGEWKLPDF
jgi:hypothetical protein